MSTAAVPESLKFVKRFLIQADQVERSKHALIAYYLRLYAVTLALALPKEQRNAEIMQYIGHLMDALEKLKGQLDALGKDKDRVRVEEFAAQLFDFADKTDRAGNATKNTALGFSAASVVFESLEYFGPLEPEIIDRIRYAKWKAADIIKALKNGQVPTPGPYNEPTEEANEPNLQFPPSYDETSKKPVDGSEQIPRLPPSQLKQGPVLFSPPQPSPSLPHARSASLSIGDEKRYYAMIADAEKKVSQALASLRFKDWTGAEALLLSALDQVHSIRSLKP